MVERGLDPVDLREWLVANCPGLGHKQASLFLRDIGYCRDLAIIDRHVVRYLEASGVASAPKTARQYLDAESKLRSHASSFGMPVGLLDQAAWFVGRAATASAR
jgi:N-glycosylase/DNA lyase